MIPVIYPQNEYTKLPNGMSVRSLIEQVQKNTFDIYNHYQVERVLAEFGIKVVGQVESSTDLPQGYQGEFGDAYAVGVEAPYNFYIWTRANAVSQSNYWLNIGPLAIVGPPGPAGKGEKGDPGEANRWYYTSDIKYLAGIGNNNDMALADDGYVYRCFDGVWSRTISIMGPQGPQGSTGRTGNTGCPGPRGPQGNPGSPGSVFNLLGTLPDDDALPDPSTVPNNSAYMISKDYSIYYTVNGVWNWVPFTGAATAILASDGTVMPVVYYNNLVKFPANYVSDNAYYAPVFTRSQDTDELECNVNLVADPSGTPLNPNGGPVWRAYNGAIYVPTSGIISDTDAVNKKYVDERAGGGSLYKTVFSINHALDIQGDGEWYVRTNFEVLTTYNPQASLQAQNGSAQYISMESLIGFLYSQNFAEGGSSLAQRFVATGALTDPGNSTIYNVYYVQPTSTALRIYYNAHMSESTWESFEQIYPSTDESAYVRYDVYRVQ